MRRIACISILVVFAFINRVSLAQNYASWSQIKNRGSGKLSVIYFNSPGLISVAKGQMKGLCVNILNDFIEYVKTSHKTTITIDFISGENDFEQFLGKVKSANNLMGITGVTITEERKSIFKFTPPYLASPIVLITNKNVPTLNHAGEVKNFTPITLASGAQLESIKRLQKKFSPDKKIIFQPTPMEVLEKISQTPDSFTILGINDFIEASRKGLNVKMQNVNMGNPEIFGFIMSKNSDWDEIWNEFLKEEYINSPSFKKEISLNLGGAYVNYVNKLNQ